ncbi:S66 family peptidase [Streptococcus iniae]|uniref:LD-carboxypeptidase n=1 Tax=Streptococcus iniae TaxID=1346 RepID=A0A3L8NEV5_STRIN|nr:S66 peptidase family protein [Streptococcus iniae]AJG25266.1 carboxypeptidase [Streptococcus iniae]ATX38991.1 Microcin C7 self-immunity protein MccF [Streptococcus iniae]EKB52355.1 MccC family protein [Streptococcus iniae 9117]ELY5747938.1 LD-carboxypeptidase [Streptococcus iniae]ELY5750220.1 LD-carboxypeptidase [Streptococcus iniae]
MIKKVAIVSLSSGILGEDFVKHELDLGISRLKEFGLELVFMPNALQGIEELSTHPNLRAQDLIDAFADPSIDMILCAIGGDDTYRLLPYLFDNDALAKVINQKVFLGFSDTTINHLILHKLGIKSFYGQSFLADICELDHDMLPYSRAFFEELLRNEQIASISPSPYWYRERTDFSAKALGTARQKYADKRGFELLKGPSQFSGHILGGCIESLYDIFDANRHPDMVSLCQKYHLFPSLEEWTGKILLLESSEEKPKPELFRKMLERLKATGIFDVISGVLVGKPMDESYYQSYRTILLEVIDADIPIVYNLNIGHATPRAIIPFGVAAQVDIDKQTISFDYP